MLAENDTGYKNLIQVASRAFMEGYYYKPRVDWDVLSDHSEGLIATSGCLGSHVNQALMQGNPARAEELAGRFRDIFGPENYYIELQDHGIPAQASNLQHLRDIADRPQAEAAGHQRHPLHPTSTTRSPTMCCYACRPARMWPTPTG